jgi:hypothetical protein
MSVNGPLNSNTFTSPLFEVLNNIRRGSFIDQLESTLPGTRDGRVNKAESQQAYDTLLAQAGDQIPQAIKDRFKDGQAFADQFDRIDALGVTDGYVDAQEFSEFLSSEGDTSTSGASAEEPPKPGPGNSGGNNPANKPKPASGDD